MIRQARECNVNPSDLILTGSLQRLKLPIIQIVTIVHPLRKVRGNLKTTSMEKSTYKCK
jgi:hypothetical protein